VPNGRRALILACWSFGFNYHVVLISCPAFLNSVHLFRSASNSINFVHLSAEDTVASDT
jgi:hypothetical protein